MLLQTTTHAFLTSDRPIALYREGASDGEPTGLANADIFMMPLSRSSALLMRREEFEIPEAWTDLTLAVRTINAVVAASSYEWIFHHPEDNPLHGIVLPRRVTNAHSEPFEYVVEQDRVRVRSRLMFPMPTPPLGWSPSV